MIYNIYIYIYLDHLYIYIYILYNIKSMLITLTACHTTAPLDCLQESSIGNTGSIPCGGIGYLKGAARVTTAMAFVVACSELKVKDLGGPPLLFFFVSPYFL